MPATMVVHLSMAFRINKMLTRWERSIPGLLFIGCLLYFTLSSLLSRPPDDGNDQLPSRASPTSTMAHPIDPDNRYMTSELCDVTFPGLSFEASRAKAWYRARGGITEHMVGEAEADVANFNARLVIKDNKVRNPDVCYRDIC
jgi:hypothetical protein